MKRGQSPQIYAGFSLVELALSLAICAVALVSLLGLLPQFMEYERDSADQTAIGTLMEDIHDRLEGQEFKEGVPSISPIFYDQQGGYWDPDAVNENSDGPLILGRKFFRGDIKLVKPAGSTNSTNSPLVIKIDFYWPIDSDGNPLGDKKPKTSVVYYTTTLTGPDWEEIDPEYRPKIEY